MRPAAAALSLVLAALLLAAASAAPPTDVQEAQTSLAKLSSPAEYAAALDALSTSLPPPDALALLEQNLANSGPEYRRSLTVKAGDLALLLGLFGDAAAQYEAASAMGSAADVGLLLRSARCYLAAGDPESASRISCDPALKTEDQSLSGAAALVGAWALALQGRPAEACAKAAGLLGVADPGGRAALPAALRREAAFVLWLFAPAEDKAGAGATLTADFPGSIEAAIVSGKASPPPLPHWYLGGLSALPSPASLPPAPPAASPQSVQAQGKRLQVGYFSVEENARALRDELLSKHFKASVEPRIRAAAPGKAEEKRWIVIVEGGKERAKTAQALKDSGYEAYVVD